MAHPPLTPPVHPVADDATAACHGGSRIVAPVNSDRPVAAPAVCVYCASSRSAHPEYRSAAHRLGEILAGRGVGIVYGGGAVGSMGALADGALGRGGRVTGILPRFMADLEWGHPGLTDLRLVEDMRTRKHLMLTLSQAAIALPGGCGTLEELLEAITLKRLGLYVNPIILVNTRGFFTPLVQTLSLAVSERFMDQRHLDMWQVVDTPEEVPGALERAPAWSPQHAQAFAAV
ncbi:MAG: TIGR00730 family Rossman fold protein [Proteobacteria bacterium]|nr:TIGR00730 family Rossman fold protein [Pseudomonadota bacterium]